MMVTEKYISRWVYIEAVLNCFETDGYSNLYINKYTYTRPYLYRLAPSAMLGDVTLKNSHF